MRSSVISDWASILLSWLPMMYTLIRFPARKEQNPFTGSATADPSNSIGEGNKTTVGTEITLFLNEESVEFANEYRVREVLEKYCSFMPVEIFLSKANAPQEYETIDESEFRDDDVVVEHIHEDAKTEEKRERER